jgi:hypothetical protein
LNLRGSAPASRLVALHLHGSVIPVDNRTEISIQFDGQPVSQLSTLDEVVEFDGGGPAGAHILGQNGLLILVSLPLQGDHVLRIEGAVPAEPQGLNPIQLAAIVAVVLVLLGIAAAVMLRRRSPR